MTLTNQPVTRSHKANDRDHKGLADGTAAPQEHLPRFFAKSGHVDVDPKKIKKDGCGKGNWYVPCTQPKSYRPLTSHRGGVGEEVVDENFRFTNARRRSNSSTLSHHFTDFKTKFEVNEQEPVFEESLHGPAADEDNADALSKTDTSESDRSST